MVTAKILLAVKWIYLMHFVWEIPGSDIGTEIGCENKFVMVSLCSYKQVLANMWPKNRERLLPFTSSSLYSLW